MADRNEHAFGVFAFLWAVAVWLDTSGALASRGEVWEHLPRITCSVLALWVICRPRAVERFVVLSLALAATRFVDMPTVSNHAFFMTSCSVFAVLAYVVLTAARRERIGAGDLFVHLAPALRWSLIAIYFWATVHKINADFFDLELSCAPGQLDNVGRRLGISFDAPLVRWTSVWATFAIEGLIPLLLLFRSTRMTGILLAAVFHYFLGAAYSRFSCMLFAMLSLFIAPSAYVIWAEELRQRSSAFRSSRIGGWTRAAWRSIGRVISVAALVLLVVTPVFFLLEPDIVRRERLFDWWFRRDFRTVVFFIHGACVLFLLAFGLRWLGWRAMTNAPAFRFPRAVVAAFPILVFLNGLSPHVGLKDTHSFAMYSNLRTDGGRTNHLFLPASMQIWDRQNDLVDILRSSDPVLGRLVRPSWFGPRYYSSYILGWRTLEGREPPPRWRLPFASLRRRITDLAERGETGIDVAYRRRGRVRVVSNAEKDPVLSTASYLERKLLMSRAVPASPKGYCLW